MGGGQEGHGPHAGGEAVDRVMAGPPTSGSTETTQHWPDTCNTDYSLVPENGRE